MFSAKVEVFIGPGRAVKATIEEISTITLELKKRVAKVTDKNGREHEFDLGNIKGLRVSNPNENTLLELRPNAF